MNYLRKTFLWILLLPYALGFLGAASNQLVLVANHGKFPVMLNPRWNTNQQPDSDGMIDDVHCVMSAETHLNLLSDIFNFHHGILSVGDLLLGWSDDMLPYTWGIWLGLILYRRERDFDGDSKYPLQTMQCPSGRPTILPVRLRA